MLNTSLRKLIWQRLMFSYLALLDHHNTLTKQSYSSPVQRLFGCRTCTLLPVLPKLLKPEIQFNVVTKLVIAKTQQANYYNKPFKLLPEIHSGEVVHPYMHVWSYLGIALGLKQFEKIKLHLDLTKYVQCNGWTYHWNWKDLRFTQKQLTPVVIYMTDVELPAIRPNDISSSELRSKVSDTSASYNNSPVSEAVQSILTWMCDQGS